MEEDKKDPAEESREEEAEETLDLPENPEFPEIPETEESAADSYEQKYLRALADYQNLLKQSAKERQDFVKFALEGFLDEIIPVYDHLKLSLKGLSEEEKGNPWAQGVTYVLKQFHDVLESHGVEEIAAVGQPFDHNLMEAVDGRGDLVKEEVMPGYTLNGKVVRPAKVIVG